jgi:hypothetical protein
MSIGQNFWGNYLAPSFSGVAIDVVSPIVALYALVRVLAAHEKVNAFGEYRR